MKTAPTKNLMPQPMHVYSFTAQTPVPPILAVTGDMAHELSQRLPIVERGLLTIHAPEGLTPFAAATFLTLQFLRTMASHRAKDAFVLAVSELTLWGTLLSICACDDATWRPSSDWPHSKAEMLHDAMKNVDISTLQSLQQVAESLEQTARCRPVAPTRGVH